jgi:hypothetical protein
MVADEGCMVMNYDSQGDESMNSRDGASSNRREKGMKEEGGRLL